MKALSIKQPWAWLICRGFKDIENREWPTKLRERIYVHTGKKFDYDGWNWLCTHPSLLREVDIEEWASQVIYPSLGAIIGEVDITDCVWVGNRGLSATKSPWFMGTFGLVLANPVLYPEPIPCKGMLRFFEPEIAEYSTKNT